MRNPLNLQARAGVSISTCGAGLAAFTRRERNAMATGFHSGCTTTGLQRFAQCIDDRGELAGDGRGDDFERLSVLSQPIGEGLQVRIAVQGRKRGLEQNLSKRSATSLMDRYSRIYLLSRAIGANLARAAGCYMGRLRWLLSRSVPA